MNIQILSTLSKKCLGLNEERCYPGTVYLEVRGLGLTRASTIGVDR
jgi:hypothetical protein